MLKKCWLLSILFFTLLSLLVQSWLTGSVFSISFQYSIWLLLWWRWGFWHYPSSSQIPELQSECLLRAGQHIHLCNIGYVSCINFIISRQVWSIKRIQTQQFQIRLCLELYMVRLLPAVEKNIWTRAQYILFGTIVKIKYKMKTILEQGVIKFPETCISLLLKILLIHLTSIF